MTKFEDYSKELLAQVVKAVGVPFEQLTSDYERGCPPNLLLRCWMNDSPIGHYVARFHNPDRQS